MTEQTCQNYLNKVLEIKNLAENPLTTKQQIETALNELDGIESVFDNDVLNMQMPLNVLHLDMYILCRIEMAEKKNIHNYLYKLLEVKEEHRKTILQDDITIEYEPFSKEIALIKQYIKDCIDGCSCMKGRKRIIQNIFRGF